MSSQAILEMVHQGELTQKENLITLLGSLNGSKETQANYHMPSMVRGLCTINQKLLSLTGQYLAKLAESDEKDGYFEKFVNDFILWFSTHFVVFEKIYQSLSEEKIMESPVLQKTILHCYVYVDLATSSSEVMKNSTIIKQLKVIRSRASQLTLKITNLRKSSSLNNISFDLVQTFGGKNVTCLFTADQIVKRTENAALFMDNQTVEMVLLNLSRRQTPSFDSLVILKVPISSENRSVIYPPFRVNELSISLAHNSISFSSLQHNSNISQSRKNCFAIRGDEIIIQQWFRDLRTIFPSDQKLVQSENVQSFGLGIETMSDTSDDETSPVMDTLSKVSCLSLDSSQSSEIMRKTLSRSGMAPEGKDKQLDLVTDTKSHQSIITEYAYPESISTPVSDSIEFFDIVKSTPIKKIIQSNPEAAMSMPDLEISQKPRLIYTNAAGSAIDVSNFGKNYTSSIPVSSRPQLVKKKSFLDLFRLKKSKDDVASESQSLKQKESVPKPADTDNHVSTKPQPQEDVSVPISVPKVPRSPRCDPDLKVEIPKHAALYLNSSQPGSALSISNRTLPSPFALPSSATSQFFTQHKNGGSTLEVNNSTAGLTIPQEEVYEIPQEFKDIVNSDDTIDYYMSPASPNLIKVSKWRQHCGKWELLTTNENVFVKIAVNYKLFKSWLLVFKEEYDEKYDEVIDKALLVIDLCETTSSRQSTALDVEINGLDSFSQAKTHIMVRCYEGSLVQSLFTNLANIIELMTSKKIIHQSTSFESSATLSPSLMSKPSTSSTLNSIFTNTDYKTPASSIYNSFEKTDSSFNATGAKLLLDRMTIKLHKQMESYEQVHKASSWKCMAMYSLDISHSIDTSQNGYYHFDMSIKEEPAEEASEEYLWSFKEDDILTFIERIGKAALLVRAPDAEIYMLECRGKKELKRLIELF